MATSEALASMRASRSILRSDLPALEARLGACGADAAAKQRILREMRSDEEGRGERAYLALCYKEAGMVLAVRRP